MATIVKDYTFADGTAARPEQVNANFDTIVTVINGNIDWDNLKASLVNAANGILKLNASGDVPLAQIPDTLTGKDADTLDGNEYAQVATDITAAIAVHAAIAAAHHTATDPTAAIAAHAADADAHHSLTNVKKIIMQEPETALNLSGRSDTGWTDLDLTSYTSALANGAFLHLSIVDTGTMGWGKVRKKGQVSAEGALQAVSWVSGAWGSSIGYVELDANRKIQYYLDATGAGTLSVKIFVFGYTEPVS